MIFFGIIDRTFIGIWLKKREKLKTITQKINIQGPVKYPGIYLTKQKAIDLKDVVKLAGGLEFGYKIFPSTKMRYTLSNFSSIDVTSYIYYIDYRKSKK